MPAPFPTSFDAPDVLRQFESVKLIAIDIDGTLALEPQKGIGDIIRYLQRSLSHARHGVTVVLATGRTFSGADAVVKGLRIFSHTPLVLYNGALTTIASGRELNALSVIPRDTTSFIISEVVHSKSTAFLYECEPIPNQNQKGQAFAEFVSGYGNPINGPVFDSNGLKIRWSEDTRTVDAAAVLIPLSDFTDRSGISTLVRRLIADPNVDVTSSSDRYVELRPAGASKSAALAEIANRLGISRDEVLAIGDSDNDVDMLKWAGIGIAVANSSPGAAAASNFMVDAAAGEAVVEVLRIVRSALRYRQR